ncbi:hypothetical protein EDD17DRAFT_1514309 [Pisolithus thermaeus]|nr:hypothetical protein EV401DRAFT_1886533 [Pisolithus croceorrhizus]KAI6148165.1 hypothetical protein EDD17DRAFT_1514309 [Pisolithus thermaeus]
MASKRVTRHASTSESDDTYFTVDSLEEDEETSPLPTFPHPLRVLPVSRAPCTPAGTVTSPSEKFSIQPGQSTSKFSDGIEEVHPFWVVYIFVVTSFQIPVTRNELQLFKETIQLELDGAVSAINEAAHAVKAHLAGMTLGAHGNAGDQEMPPLLQVHRKIWNSNGNCQKLICEHALALMKHENKHSLSTNVPSRAEAAAYTKRAQQPCCTADNFRVDLNNTPASTWNMSTSHVFAASFHDAHPGCGRSLKTIFDAWVVHFNYLRQVYAKQQMVAHEEQARIMNIASGVMETLHVLDVLHLWMRYQQQWNGTTGAWPHLHIPSSWISNREPSLCLLKNFYAQDYLSSLTAEGLDGLLLQDDIPLSIPPAITASVPSLTLHLECKLLSVVWEGVPRNQPAN